jgi:hypothetical protein
LKTANGEILRGEESESGMHLAGKPNPRIRGAGDEKAWRITIPVHWQTGIFSAAMVGSEGSDVQTWVEHSTVKKRLNHQPPMTRSIALKFELKFIPIVFILNPRICRLGQY